MQYKKLTCMDADGNKVKIAFIGHKGKLSIQFFKDALYADSKGKVISTSLIDGASLELTSPEVAELMELLEETRLDNMLGI